MAKRKRKCIKRRRFNGVLRCVKYNDKDSALTNADLRREDRNNRVRRCTKKRRIKGVLRCVKFTKTRKAACCARCA